MKKNIRNVFVLLVFLSSASFGFSFSEELKETTDRVFGMLINCDFEEVFIVSDSLIASDSTEPLFPFFKLCAFGLRDLDYDLIIDTVGFLDTYEKTLLTIKKYEKIKGKDSYSLMFLGFAYATQASFYLLHKKYFSALGTGLDAIDIFEESKEMDSLNYDADFFLGFSNYVKGELRKKLWMVLFWYSGSKKDGLKSLELCSEYAYITDDAAKLILADVYAEEKQYDRACKLADSLLVKYPKSRMLWWSKARYYERLKMYLEAGKEYERLANSYDKEKYGKYNALVSRCLQIKALKKIKQKEKVILVASLALKDDICSLGKRYNDVCKDIKRLVRNCK